MMIPSIPAREAHRELHRLISTHPTGYCIFLDTDKNYPVKMAEYPKSHENIPSVGFLVIGDDEREAIHNGGYTRGSMFAAMAASCKADTLAYDWIKYSFTNRIFTSAKHRVIAFNGTVTGLDSIGEFVKDQLLFDALGSPADIGETVTLNYCEFTRTVRLKSRTIKTAIHLVEGQPDEAF